VKQDGVPQLPTVQSEKVRKERPALDVPAGRELLDEGERCSASVDHGYARMPPRRATPDKTEQPEIGTASDHYASTLADQRRHEGGQQRLLGTDAAGNSRGTQNGVRPVMVTRARTELTAQRQRPARLPYQVFIERVG